VTRTPDGLPALRDVIRAHGLTAHKGLGQNFILDFNLTRRIARCAGPLVSICVVEIGAGPGGLTRALFLEGAARVVAVERDQRCLSILGEIAEHYPGRLDIVCGDALELDLAALAPSPSRIVANLPYGSATELLARWLTTEPWPPWYDKMVLMFQREVAERLVSPPNRKSYGRLSVLAQWRSTPRVLFTLSPRAFTPAPKVESALVELVPTPEPEPAGSCAVLQTVVAAAFGQRRKMLRKSLSSVFQDTENTLKKVDIDPSLRAEALTVSQFCALARLLHENNS
jgi:16S rRNA (adenine1518-N6/adenine1519-N6)-dimethyltransferase